MKVHLDPPLDQKGSYLLTGVTIDTRPGSVEVFGATLSYRQSALRYLVELLPSAADRQRVWQCTGEINQDSVAWYSAAVGGAARGALAGLWWPLRAGHAFGTGKHSDCDETNNDDH
jgi:hypothetical protein